MTDMADFEDFESGTAVQYAPEEPEKTEEKGDSGVAYDVDLGNNIEFEVETEPAPQPEPEPEPEREYGRPAYRRMNKHIYTWVLSFFLGIYGADRFARGQIGLGLLKLMTFGGFGFWYLADLAIAMMKSYAGEYRDSDDVYFDMYGQYTT